MSDDMIGHARHIVNGHLDGKEVKLLKVRGKSKKRILVKIHGIIADRMLHTASHYELHSKYEG